MELKTETMSNQFSGQLAADLENAFNQFGASMMRDEFAAKLLAYVYVMGGGNEAVTIHEGLHAGIRIAQEKFNIKGGEIPSATGILLIQKYVYELEKKELHCPWLSEIGERYNLDMHLKEPDFSVIEKLVKSNFDVSLLMGLL